MTKFTEGRHPGEVLLSEAEFHRSRDSLRIGAEQTILPGHVLGSRAIVAEVTASASAGAGNAGNATIALAAPAVSSKAKNGTYTGIAVTATTVRWEDPSGKEVGTSTHGQAFNKEIKLTITAGGTANVAGDTFAVVVNVEKGDVEHVAWNPTASDGSEVVAGVALYGVTTGVDEKAETAGITRDAQVKGFALILPEGVTADQTAQAHTGLKALGIIVR